MNTLELKAIDSLREKYISLGLTTGTGHTLNTLIFCSDRKPEGPCCGVCMGCLAFVEDSGVWLCAPDGYQGEPMTFGLSDIEEFYKKQEVNTDE